MLTSLSISFGFHQTLTCISMILIDLVQFVVVLKLFELVVVLT